MSADSIESMVSQLDIFSPSVLQTSVTAGDWQHFAPVQAISKDGPIQFLVPGQGQHYVDLNKTLLYLRFKAINGTTGANLSADDKVTIINNPLNSIFGDVKMEFNQTTVSHANNMNHYRSYIELLFNFNSESKDTHLTSALFYQDKAGGFNDIDSKANKVRGTYLAGSKEVEVCGRLHCDLLSIDKYLLNDVDIRITLTRNPNSLLFMAADEKISPQLEILEAKLFVRKVDVSPGILIAHAKTLENAVAQYHYKRVELFNYTMGSGLYQKTLENLFLNRIPSRIIFGLVKNSAFSGNFGESPFNFEHFDTNYVNLSINGRSIGSAPYKPNYTDDKCVLPYLFSFFGAGMHLNDDGYCVSRQDYKSGYALYCYDTLPDLSSSESYLSPATQGSCRLELGFAKPLQHVVNCIIYAEFPDTCEIDRNRQIHIQYKK